MPFFKNLFSPKRQRIIESVRDYFNGKISEIPYSSKDIEKTIQWVKNADLDQKQILLERLAMAEVLVRSKEMSK